MASINITQADSIERFEEGRLLFQEYAHSLDFDLQYQDFKNELLTIREQYSEPNGALLLCHVDDVAVGCVGVRLFSEGIAELKRLYVKPEYRSLKIGRKLLESAIAISKQLNYRFIRLDTVPGQTKAQELYRFLGFYEIGPYRNSPIEGTMYFEKKLEDE